MQLTATMIASILGQTRAEGRSACLVTILPTTPTPSQATPAGTLTRRLIVEADALDQHGDPIRHGTLGDQKLDRLVVDHARLLIADERTEIAVARPRDIVSNPDTTIPDESSDYRLLFEISRPPLELVICGGGHVGQAVARAARLLGFRITVIDDRIEFASREKFPDSEIKLIADDFIAALRSINLTPATHIVIVTRGHRHDEICLREVVDRPVRYLGMIGSRRRTTTIRQHLRRDGVDPLLLHRIHAPIGLDIGALTPEEIAIAILAEIVLVRRGGTGLPKSADGPMTKAR
jgi:xanthine dehydrogenase accessory factor